MKFADRFNYPAPKPERSDAPHNACIDIIADYLARRPTQDADIKAAFAELKAAALKPNPMYQELSRRMRKSQVYALAHPDSVPQELSSAQQQDWKEAKGLTHDEVTIATSYVLARAIPTLSEIAFCTSLMTKGGDIDGARKVFHNLHDEMYGNDYHLKLLYDSITDFSQKLGVQSLGPISYPWAIVAFQYQEEHGKMPNAAQLIDYAIVKENPIASRRKGGLNMDVERTVGYTMMTLEKILPLLPKTSHHYEEAIGHLTGNTTPKPATERNLCEAALCLGLRESSSAEQSGIVGIYDVLLNAYADRFSKKDFVTIKRWGNEHIGQEGVEDRHEAEANEKALRYVDVVYKHNPKELAAIFRRQAELLRVRTKQAQDFADAMAAARIQGLNQDIVPFFKADLPAKPSAGKKWVEDVVSRMEQAPTSHLAWNF